MKSLLISLFSCISFFATNFQSVAQDPQFSQYYAAPLYLNPGLTGVNQKGRAGVNYRTQWPNLDANFVTTAAYVDYNFRNYNSSLGFLITSDKEGEAGFQSLSMGVLYAFQLQIIGDWFFRPGLEASYAIRDIDYTRLTFGDQYDNTGLVNPQSGETFDNQKVSFLDLGFGGVVFNKNLWIGLSMHHILEPVVSFATERNPSTLPIKSSIHGGYKISLKKSVKNQALSLTPTFNYKSQGKSDQLDLGTYFGIKDFLIGLWYRGLPIKKFEEVSNNESIIALLGFTKNGLTVGYSYDATISNLSLKSGGAHEISLAFDFNLSNKYEVAPHLKKLDCPIPFAN